MGNLVIFYHLSAFEIWPDKRVAFGENGIIRGRQKYTSLCKKVLKYILLNIFKIVTFQSIKEYIKTGDDSH